MSFCPECHEPLEGDSAIAIPAHLAFVHRKVILESAAYYTKGRDGQIHLQGWSYSGLEALP